MSSQSFNTISTESVDPITRLVHIINAVPVELRFEIMLYWPRAAVPQDVMDSKYFYTRWSTLHCRTVEENFDEPGRHMLKRRASNYEDDELVKVEEMFDLSLERDPERRVTHYKGGKIAKTEVYYYSKLARVIYFRDEHRLLECTDYFGGEWAGQVHCHYWWELQNMDVSADDVGNELRWLKWGDWRPHGIIAYKVAGPQEYYQLSGKPDRGLTRSSSSWLHKSHQDWYENVLLRDLQERDSTGVVPNLSLVRSLLSPLSTAKTLLCAASSTINKMSQSMGY